MAKRVFLADDWSVLFADPREFWNSLSKHEVTKEFEDEHGVNGPTALAVAITAFEKDAAYGPLIETKQKNIGSAHCIDGVFDLQVRNATYARLTTEEKSETFTPIEFVNKNGVFVLEGCDSNHPLFLPHFNLYARVEKFKVETDADTIQYRQFVMCPKKLKQFFAELVKLHFSSIFANERVVLAGIDAISYTFQLNESHNY